MLRCKKSYIKLIIGVVILYLHLYILQLAFFSSNPMFQESDIAFLENQHFPNFEIWITFIL